MKKLLLIALTLGLGLSTNLFAADGGGASNTDTPISFYPTLKMRGLGTVRCCVCHFTKTEILPIITFIQRNEYGEALLYAMTLKKNNAQQPKNPYFCNIFIKRLIESINTCTDRLGSIGITPEVLRQLKSTIEALPRTHKHKRILTQFIADLIEDAEDAMSADEFLAAKIAEYSAEAPTAKRART